MRVLCESRGQEERERGRSQQRDKNRLSTFDSGELKQNVAEERTSSALFTSLSNIDNLVLANFAGILVRFSRGVATACTLLKLKSILAGGEKGRERGRNRDNVGILFLPLALVRPCKIAEEGSVWINNHSAECESFSARVGPTTDKVGE